MKHHPHRLEPGDYIGCRAYSLTICTHHHSRPFLEATAVQTALLHFLHAASAEQCEILAYCFMPDHVHAIVLTCADSADLRRFVCLAKQHSGVAFAKATRHRLWQKSYFDRTIRTLEELPELVGYLIRNPVRARLVDDPVAYPYWGSQRYSREELLEFVMSAKRR